MILNDLKLCTEISEDSEKVTAYMTKVKGLHD